MTPTKISQYLEKNRIRFRWLPHQTEAVSIADAAQQRGIRPHQMVKCILLRDMGNKHALACVPGDESVDPKKVREALGWRRMTCVCKNDIKQIINYQAGTITPLFIPEHIPVIFDSTLYEEPEVTISSGHTMAGILLSIKDLNKLVLPRIYDIVRKTELSD
ncbi:aminoacyl-tRNA deacylase [Vibrio salinus]|uniref:aminoacyl-tRNA deacylase n=1 Tax=Vibrio salinus TaxID=2899784 RepID=UPI001E36D9EB|nr:YbaK/EbsC family protein [Vibrio salinus]MCE0493428.1 YbaK/EbsC family protein [Vibrio salinus]